MPVTLPVQQQRLTRRHFLVGSGAVAAGLAIYSGEIARHEIDIVRRTIYIDNLPTAFHGFTIAQLSDIHLVEYTEPIFLERVIEHTNALKPDLVLLTGDFVTHGAFSFFDSPSSAHRCAEMLTALTAPLRYSILGNHDNMFGAQYVIEALTTHDTPVLINQNLPIDIKGDRIWLAGTADATTSTPNLDLTLPTDPKAPVILMVHEPDYADTVIQHPRGPLVDLMLSGHSHGGQVRLPLLGALVTPPMGEKYIEGHFRLKRMQLYVNRGIGTVGVPFRLNCPPEITLFTLQPSRT
ncbi:metallophosphoesterase [Edaphobacter acidisoli]|uniref:Metallophosphoesterase n=1 Tax=Edaphobacter acidisoli TaxID=2040573 RepID=A0A916W0P7_9BACT|nr:metallophosphoesterase [Edaphobacter acidisoli]GGA58285.1 metallophosphoesterase [Edaphobacter acidisoli]